MIIGDSTLIYQTTIKKNFKLLDVFLKLFLGIDILTYTINKFTNIFNE